MKRLIATALALIMTASLLNAEEREGQEVNETASVTHELMRFAGNIHQLNSIFPQEKVYIQFDITVDGNSKSFTLPRSEVRGLVMQAVVLGHEGFMLHVDCTPDMAGEMLGVALTCRGELYGFQTIETSSLPRVFLTS